MAVQARQRSTPTRKLVVCTLGLAILLSSLSLFSSVTLSKCRKDAYTAPQIHSTALAANQSHGYLTGIGDESWQRMQERARSWGQYKDPTEPGKRFWNVKLWNLNNIQPDFTCPHMRRVGGHGAGPKWTCDPHRLLDSPKCLIYSIGSEGKYAFEDGLISLLGSPHCEIHVFDTNNTKRQADLELKNIHYHEWGLKSSYDPMYKPQPSLNTTFEVVPEFYSFPEMVKKLGHEARTIDILKIHCDKCEWATYRDWVTANVRQILVETHGVPSPKGRNPWHHKPMKVQDFFDSFRANNFALFSKEINVLGDGAFYEFGYVKLDAQFWRVEKPSFWQGLLGSLSWFQSSEKAGCYKDQYTQKYPDAPRIVLPSSLARSQSYGFFDTIIDDSWRLMQQRARESVQYMYPSQPEFGHEKAVAWYMNNLQPDFTCPQLRRIGGHGDGPKWTCDPHRLVDSGSDCLIYSVGSEGKYEWEDSMIELIGDTHCEIHVFDPGNYGRRGDALRRNIHYHQWGLKSSYDNEYNAKITKDLLGGSSTNLRSFPETLKLLGHEDRTIEILKLDCENCEWANYKDWVSLDIRQILIETHGVPSPVEGNNYYHSPMQVADFFDAFRENDYVMFSKEVNVHGGGRCVEYSYIKLHPDFWGQHGKQLTQRQPPASKRWTLSSLLP